MLPAHKERPTKDRSDVEARDSGSGGKGFYDIALLFLSAHGYKDLSVVDGTGDGGRDVTCSLKDLRIQLSVRKDWPTKVNDESRLTKSAGKSAQVLAGLTMTWHGLLGFRDL